MNTLITISVAEAMDIMKQIPRIQFSRITDVADDYRPHDEGHSNSNHYDGNEGVLNPSGATLEVIDIIGLQ